MNKAEFEKEIAKQMGISVKDAEKYVLITQRVITDALLRGEKVQIKGFGTLEPRKRTARGVRNPANNQIMQVPESNRVKFKAGNKLLEALN